MAQTVTRMLTAGDPGRIILFGSRARGDAQSDSDYDFLQSRISRIEAAGCRAPACSLNLPTY